LKTIWNLVKKDLLRDLKNPWGILVLMLIPLLLSYTIATIFGGGDEDEISIVLHVALLDQDQKMIGNMLRSMAGNQETGRNLQLHLVENPDEGIRLLEKQEVSALVVLPENLTSSLIDGVTTTISFYPNPAQTVLPKVVEQGIKLIAVVLSQGAVLLAPQMEDIRKVIDDPDAISHWEMAMMFYRGLQKVEQLEPYLFPPIIQYDTIPASEYVPMASREQIPEATDS
jgi:hypothetical protein